MRKHNVGDQVVLNSGGPIMTVHKIGDFPQDGFNPGVLCVWFNGATKAQDVFHPDALSPYRDERYSGANDD